MTRVELWLSALTAALAGTAATAGLFSPDIYRDPAILLPQNQGTDAVTLAFAVPLLVLAAVATRRGSLSGRILWLGVLGYLTYAFGMYPLAVRWNPLFLLYVATFGCALYALILGMLHTDPERVRAALAARAPARAVAAYLIGVALLVAGLWLREEIPAALTGTVPVTVRQFETPTNVVHVFDLGIVLPALVLAGVQLLRDRPWGYVLAGMLLVKAAAIGLWVIVMIWFSARRGIGAPAAYTAFFGLLTLAGVLLTWRFLAARRLGD